jgi:hypothetical protein
MCILIVSCTNRLILVIQAPLPVHTAVLEHILFRQVLLQGMNDFFVEFSDQVLRSSAMVLADNSTVFSATNYVPVSGSMVSCSPGMASCPASGLVDNITAISFVQKAPNTELASCSNTAYVQINMNRVVSVSGVRFWQYYSEPTRVYCNVKVELSSTCAFSGEQTSVYHCLNNCPVSTSDGVRILVKNIPAQCIRWQSSRSNLNTGAHFMELQVFPQKGTTIFRE